jgi:predicted DNA-binding transcriptional regulator YafY
MTDYPYLRAWCEMMGSFRYYTEDQIADARKENAPQTAIYKAHEGHWRTFEDIENPGTKERIAGLVKRYLG